MGTLTSPAFTVAASHPYLSWLMTGGNGSADVGLELLDASDTVVAQYKPSTCGAAKLDGRKEGVHYFDLTGRVGETLKVRIFDRESGGCGFVSFDHVVLSDKPTGNKRN
jgi:hypothetical protein